MLALRADQRRRAGRAASNGIAATTGNSEAAIIAAAGPHRASSGLAADDSADGHAGFGRGTKFFGKAPMDFSRDLSHGTRAVAQIEDRAFCLTPGRKGRRVVGPQPA